MFVVILNLSYVEAKSLKKGEEFKEESGNMGIIRVVSSDEVEIVQGSDIFLGKYTIDGERVRIIIGTPGTTMVRYYKITPYGLVEEKGWLIYYFKAALAALKEKGRFKDNGNGTVTDKITKLMWQKEDDSTKRAWEPAISYCKGLSIGSYSDWRLPKIEELKSMIDKSLEPTINTTYFPNTKSSFYWSSTAYAGFASTGWVVNFYNGRSDSNGEAGLEYVRCVRGGQ